MRRSPKPWIFFISRMSASEAKPEALAKLKALGAKARRYKDKIIGKSPFLIFFSAPNALLRLRLMRELSIIPI